MNNFDKSSSGVNLTLNCFHDTDRSRSDFEESFHILQHAGFRQHSVLVFNQFGNFDVTDFDLTDYENYDPKSYTVKDLKKMLLDDGYFFKDVMQMSKADMVQELAGSEVFQEFLQENAKPTFTTLTSRGYSQGDYIEIILTKDIIEYYVSSFEELKTAEQVAEFLQSTIDHLLWDAPIYARLEIETDQGDNEFYFDEYLTDYYNYDKDQLLQIFNDNYSGDHKVYIGEWLADNLPDHADYM